MKSKIRNILIGIAVVLAILAVAGNMWWRDVSVAALPQIDGTINLPGLDGPVEVVRDPMGIPHIYASTEHDLFFAQGYVEAQDRFWQMDFQRHTARGRLSEMLGEATLDTDKFLQSLGWERVARQELDMLDAETIAILEAYAAGVNAYIGGRDKSELALEYTFLGLVNSDYEVAPWEPLDTLAWPKAMAWDLRGNMGEEINRALLLATHTAEQIATLYPEYPADAPIIVNDLTPFVQTEGAGVASVSSAYAQQAIPAMEEVASYFALLDDVFGGAPDDSVGSNSWAIGGDMTDTGMPILANDPHLSAAIPHIWYEVGLHCMPKGADCDVDMVGFSFPGTPAIVIGHTDKIAWSFTNVGPDVIDLFIEKINPDNPYQYEFEGEWRDMDVVIETIQVAGGDPVELEVRITHHGPIITDVYGSLADFDEVSGLDFPENYAISIQWTALEPGLTLQSVIKFSRATDFESFRDAARDFVAPSQNLVYTDVNGNIGYQMPGYIPIRAEGANGLYPVPGWTGEHEWLGYVPFDELPYAFNPEEGYIVTANNAVVGDEYPYHIADTWAYGYRAQRVVDMIESAPGPITVDYIKQMQGDNTNINAEFIVPILLALPLDDAHLADVREMLRDWDYQNDMDSPEAALFESFWRFLLEETFYDEINEEIKISGNSRWGIVIRNLIEEPDNFWWDHAQTDAVEDRDTIMARALLLAVADLEDRLGKDATQWAWGDLHLFYLDHGVMSNFPIAPSIFNKGPFSVAGGSSIVNASNWKVANHDYYVDGTSVSFRMVVDMSDLSNSWVIHPTGQSGHPYSNHYIDMIDNWRFNEHVRMYFEYDAVKAAAEGVLILAP